MYPLQPLHFHSCRLSTMKRKIDFDISSMRAAAPEAGSSSSGSSSINPWTQRSYSSKYYEILQKRKQLPVYEFKDALEKAVKENQVVIVEGETGSGKIKLAKYQQSCFSTETPYIAILNYCYSALYRKAKQPRFRSFCSLCSVSMVK